MKIYCHWDADGITAGVLFMKAYPEYEPYFPESKEFGDTTNWIKGDVMVDMKPIDSNIEGLVIDHHPGHSEDKKYKLIFGEKPASVLVYEFVNDRLDVDDRWKVVIGAVGDMSADKIPSEIWREYPDLLKTEGYSQKFFQLSPCINAYTRQGAYYEAFQKLYNAKTWDDILYDDEVKMMKQKVNDEMNRVMEECNRYIFDNITFVDFESDYDIGGYLASRLGRNRPIVVFNRKTKSGSVRGYLCPYIKEELEKELTDRIVIGGHTQAMGYSIQSEEDVEIIKHVLKRI